jgi:hypothetical protein
VNIDAPKLTDNIWIGVSHVFLPTFWCSKCNSWSSHHDKIHDERIRWQNMKDAQVEKQVEYRKHTHPCHYGPPQLQDRTYGRNDNNKLSSTAYVVTTTKTNVQEMIAADHPREIASTPTRAVRAAQVITTEMVQLSTTTKRNIRSHTTTPRFTQHHRKSSNTCPITQPQHHSSKEQENTKTIERKDKINKTHKKTRPLQEN